MSMQQFIVRNSLIVFAIQVASAVFGLLREASVAYMFGASGLTDAYLVAITAPTVISATITGSITSTFVTVYANLLAKGDFDKAQYTANNLLSLFVLILSGISIVFYQITPAVVHLLAPSYSEDIFQLTTDLVRVMIPNIFFGGLVGILVGVNNSHHSFVAPAAVGLVANTIMIASIFTLSLKIGIMGLAVGTMLGVIAQCALQFFAAKKSGFRYKFIIDLKDHNLRELAILVAPFVFSAAAGQVSIVVSRILSTSLPAGAVSALYFSEKIVFLPTMLTGALCTVTFPLLIRSVAQQNWTELLHGFRQTIRLLLLAAIPVIVIIYVLRYKLVEVLLQRGMFTPESTVIIADTIPYLLGAFLFGSIVSVLINVFYAMKKTATFVTTGVITLAINIVLSYMLVDFLAQKGLALASTLSVMANMVMLTGILLTRGLYPPADIKNLLNNLLVISCKIAVAAVAMGVVMGYVEAAPANALPIILRHAAIKVILAGILGGLTYTGVLYLLRVKELSDGLDWLRTKTATLFR